ncbi:MAG: exodeoxyribonuclease V subunit gamma [Oscillospiraceae bacterium]|jgi:ATP-dependent helicase/nuclease subunit B|nr:exodeoxyribonuclease V subunit gamma [Oscillospiraceae bacterium]
MLKIVTARAGHGKTEYAHRTILNALEEASRPVWLLVPEQYAFISERDLIDRIGEKNADRVHVRSFTRLAHTLLRLPEETFRPLSPGDRSVCMSLALEGVQDKLSLYAGKEAHSGIVRELLRLTTELRQSGTDEKKLLAVANQLPQGDFLRQKLSDILLVSGAYDALCSASFLDEETLLDRLCEQLPESRPFDGDLVVLNAFHGLTGQEMRVLGHILRQAKEVVFLLCADSADPPNDPAGAFTHTRATAQELKRLAERVNSQITTCGLQLTSRAPDAGNTPSLQHLEQNLFSRDAVPFEGKALGITIHAAQTLQDECAWAALQIKKLVREQNLHCRDIAVIARDSTQYEAPLRAALRSCGLPLFPDSRQPVAAQPLLLLVRAALDICVGGLRTEHILQLLKTNLAGLSIEETALLENYAFIWRIDGAAWSYPFTLHPDGLTERPADNTAERLASLEELRRRAVEPLITLRNATKEALTGEELAYALWRLLASYGTAEAVRGTVAVLRAQNEDVIAEEQARVWDSLIALLDRFVLLIDRPAPVARLRELFTLMLEAETLGAIPQGLDEPAIGSANRMRFCQSPKAVFVLGCNAGVFPLEDNGGGLLTSAEREKLQRLELPLSPCGEARQAQERFFVYHALSAARERLYLSYRKQNADGSEMPPSDFVDEIHAMFPQGLCSDDDGLLFAESPAFSFGELARRRLSPDGTAAAIRAALTKNPAWHGKLNALERAASRKPFALERPSAKLLFGENLRFSASKAESYARCPFGYFCEYGIKAKPRRQVKIDPMRRGTLLHFVLEKLFTQIGRERLLTLEKETCLTVVQELIEAYRREKLDGLEHTRRLAALLERNARTLCEVLWRLLDELRQSDFIPTGFEVQLGGKQHQNSRATQIDLSGEGLPPYELRLPGGGKISFTGKIDRVDEATLDGEKYLRVVDYKSGGKKLKMEDVLGGLQVQLLIYLFALQKARPGTKPAAILYQPVTVKAKGTRAGKETSAMPSGLFLDDLRVLRAMERDMAKKYIPIGVTAKGEISKSKATKEAVKTLEEFAALKTQVDALLADFGEQIAAGTIPALPARDAESCAYCDYHAVCLHEDSDGYRELDAGGAGWQR